MVEADLPGHISTELLIAFAVTTTILIAVHLFALMVSTCILPHVDAIAARQSPESDAVRESPHRRMQKYIELAWIFSTCIGIVLFLLELAIICWIKFANLTPARTRTTGRADTNSSVSLYSIEMVDGNDRWIAALVATIIIAVVVVMFLLFAAHYYHFIVLHKYEISSKAIAELQALTRDLDNVNEGSTRTAATASVKPYVHSVPPVQVLVADELDSETSSYHEAKSTIDETGV